MFELLKKSFKTTNDCIILVAPLAIFTMILVWYFVNIILKQNTLHSFIMSVATMFVLVCGLMSLWLYMAKKIIDLSKRIFVFERDRQHEILNIILKSPKGIGKYFLPVIGIVFSYMLIFLTAVLIINGGHSILLSKLLTVKYGILKFVVVDILTMFITLFWVPEIIYSEKNYFKSLYYSVLKNIFNIKQTFILFIIIYLLLGLTFTTFIYLINNPILYFSILMIFYYFFVFTIVLLFTYYEQHFIKNGQ